MTAEVIEPFAGSSFTTERVSFVTDDIVVQRYVEMEGALQKVLAVVKMRGSAHATDFRAYDLTASGAVIGESLGEYHGITTGVPTLDGNHDGASDLTDDERSLVDTHRAAQGADAR